MDNVILDILQSEFHHKLHSGMDVRSQLSSIVLHLLNKIRGISPEPANGLPRQEKNTEYHCQVLYNSNITHLYLNEGTPINRGINIEELTW